MTMETRLCNLNCHWLNFNLSSEAPNQMPGFKTDLKMSILMFNLYLMVLIVMAYIICHTDGNRCTGQTDQTEP